MKKLEAAKQYIRTLEEIHKDFCKKREELNDVVSLNSYIMEITKSYAKGYSLAEKDNAMRKWQEAQPELVDINKRITDLAKFIQVVQDDIERLEKEENAGK